jgi:hypothetical protein
MYVTLKVLDSSTLVNIRDFFLFLIATLVSSGWLAIGSPKVKKEIKKIYENGDSSKIELEYLASS